MSYMQKWSNYWTIWIEAMIGSTARTVEIESIRTWIVFTMHLQTQGWRAHLIITWWLGILSGMPDLSKKRVPISDTVVSWYCKVCTMWVWHTLDMLLICMLCIAQITQIVCCISGKQRKGTTHTGQKISLHFLRAFLVLALWSSLVCRWEGERYVHMILTLNNTKN